MKMLKLMADYECHPLWDLTPGMYGDVDPSSLPISDGLKQSLASWAREFDNTLNKDDPANSGFASDQIAIAFKERGVELAKQLQAELGSDYLVSVNV